MLFGATQVCLPNNISITLADAYVYLNIYLLNAASASEMAIGTGRWHCIL